MFFCGLFHLFKKRFLALMSGFVFFPRLLLKEVGGILVDNKTLANMSSLFGNMEFQKYDEH